MHSGSLRKAATPGERAIERQVPASPNRGVRQSRFNELAVPCQPDAPNGMLTLALPRFARHEKHEQLQFPGDFTIFAPASLRPVA